MSDLAKKMIAAENKENELIVKVTRLKKRNAELQKENGELQSVYGKIAIANYGQNETNFKIVSAGLCSLSRDWG